MDRDPGTTRGLWRSRWAAIGAACAVALGAGGLYTVRADTAPSSLVAVTPTRVLDTRLAAFAGAVASDQPRTLTVTGTIPTVGADGTTVANAQVVPAGATAIVANVTAVFPTSAGFVSVRPGTATGVPTTSSINFTAGGVVAPNAVTVELPTTGANAGQIQLYFKGGAPGATTHLLVDIVGYYLAGSGTPGPQGPAGATGPAGPAGPAGPSGNGAKQQRLVAFTNGPTPLMTDFETQPAIALGADRVPIVAFFNDTLDDLYVVRCVAACGATATTPVENSGSVGARPSIAIGSDGLAVIAHSRGVGTGLFLRHCSNIACDASTGVTLDAAAGFLTPSSIAIGSDGFPLIAYSNDSDVRTIHCVDVTCNVAVPIVTHTTAVTDGRYVSVAIGSDGLPVIVHQTGDGDLAVTRCANVACSSSTQVIADNPAGPALVGYDASVAIGVDGFPVIAHRVLSDGTETGSDLRITRCTNVTCSTAVSATVDAGPNKVGYFSSIAVGTDGVPLVAYRDDTAGNLRIARCTDATCGAVEIVPNDAGPGSGAHASMIIDALGLPVIAHSDTTTNEDIRLTIVTSQGWGP